MTSVSGPRKSARHNNLSQNEARKQISKKLPKSDGARSTSKTASHSRGKIIKRDMGTHKLLFTKDGLPDGIEVTYVFGGKPRCKGYKADTGIFCFCCNTVISPSQFESHAGFKSRRKPYSYIYVDIDIENEQKSLSLDTFSSIVRAKGGNHSLVCNEGDEAVLFCSRCSDSFRRASLSLPFVPTGKWYCKSCRESFQSGECGKHDAVASASISGVFSENQIADPCSYPEDELTACVLCGGHIFERSGFGPQTVIFCDQCDKEYHVGCLKKHNMADLKELPEEEWFCCFDCKRIYTVLKDLVVSGAAKLSDSILDITREKLNGKDVKSVTDMDVRWRLVDAKAVSQESKLLLSETLALFHDCFDPIVDQVTRVDLIRSMVYGEKVRDQDFSGMHCAILTVNSSVVSAGLLRIFGSDVAELPLVATSKHNQGKGYLRLLFSCVEKLLSFLNVKSFVLPAASQAKALWMYKFGFEKVPSKQLNSYNNTCCPIVAFEGTVLLSKAVPQCETTCRDAFVFDLSA